MPVPEEDDGRLLLLTCDARSDAPQRICDALHKALVFDMRRVIPVLEPGLRIEVSHANHRIVCARLLT